MFEISWWEDRTTQYTHTLQEAEAVIRQKEPDAVFTMGNGQKVEHLGLDEAMDLRAHHQWSLRGSMSADVGYWSHGEQQENHIAEVRWVSQEQALEKQREQQTGMER